MVIVCIGWVAWGRAPLVSLTVSLLSNHTAGAPYQATFDRSDYAYPLPQTGQQTFGFAGELYVPHSAQCADEMIGSQVRAYEQPTHSNGIVFLPYRSCRVEWEQIVREEASEGRANGALLYSLKDDAAQAAERAMVDLTHVHVPVWVVNQVAGEYLTKVLRQLGNETAAGMLIAPPISVEYQSLQPQVQDAVRKVVGNDDMEGVFVTISRSQADVGQADRNFFLKAMVGVGITGIVCFVIAMAVRYLDCSSGRQRHRHMRGYGRRGVDLGLWPTADRTLPNKRVLKQHELDKMPCRMVTENYFKPNEQQQEQNLQTPKAVQARIPAEVLVPTSIRKRHSEALLSVDTSDCESTKRVKHDQQSEQHAPNVSHNCDVAQETAADNLEQEDQQNEPGRAHEGSGSDEADEHNYSGVEDVDEAYSDNEEEENNNEHRYSDEANEISSDGLSDGSCEETQEEMRELENLIPGLSEQYRLVGKIGEGTFSTVYKAIDLQHERYDNSGWTMIFDAGRDQRASQRRRRARVVAIKKIYVTSSPTRIANEISILSELRGSRFIAPLVTAMRREDQVVVVLPYFRNDDFRRFYSTMHIDEMRWYFASLLGALEHAHSHGIMHRDIKPSNFLYDLRRRHGVLVDFGLAERECDQEATRARSRHTLQMDASTAMRLFRSFDQRGRPGIPRKDTRPGLRANRAGTRGFRAPEVLLKVPRQSVAIDMWSVGVILLCMLTRRFPFFQSTDDTEALLEIAVLFGRLEMERAVSQLGRTFLTNVPTVKDRGIRFESLAKAYNAEGYPNLPPDVFDLLRRLLTLDPEKRITASEALQHSFVVGRK
ncbi:Cell division control protein 7 [Coemansia brasiliensis]|uniref:non-specific serine/threonine protein kinase n=1 Tax=Coemansia brasiliensis TaxID=2650707 RepID=A0A9W8IHI8_9FUNG|nr:Cell division control protein 7 [Coemansia brasiliensis]